MITREYPPDTGWGGIATFAQHLALGLVEIGHEVEVVSLAKDKAKTVYQDGVHVHRVEQYLQPEQLVELSRFIPYSRYVLSTSAAMWRKFLELHQSDPFDVIDTPELLAEGIFPALTKIAPLTIRLYTPHSKFIAERLHNVTPTFDHLMVATIERVAMLSSNAITSPSRDLADFVSKDLNFPLENIRIVWNPIDHLTFSPEGERKLDEAEFVKADQPIKVLFVGRLEGRKGIHYLVDAIPEVVKNAPNVHFYILGDDTNNAVGQKSVKVELEEKIAQAGVGHHVTFIGRQPLAHLPAFYRSADISVVPSVYDNSPYSCLEAMSCGTPVVGTAAGGTPEYLGLAESDYNSQNTIKDCQAGLLVPSKDSQALAKAIIRLAQDAGLRKSLADKGRQRASTIFCRAEIARQTVEVYKSAIANFNERQGSGLYLKSADQILGDLDAVIKSLNILLQETLWKWSFRYRARATFNRARTSPRRFLASTARSFSAKLTGKSKGKTQ